MIKVIITQNSQGKVEEFEMSGHADYDVHGKDLVCAGASAVVFGSVNSLFVLTDSEPDVDMADDGGYLRIKLINPDDEKVQLIMDTMIISLRTIESEYSDFIKLEYK